MQVLDFAFYNVFLLYLFCYLLLFVNKTSSSDVLFIDSTFTTNMGFSKHFTSPQIFSLAMFSLPHLSSDIVARVYSWWYPERLATFSNRYAKTSDDMLDP